MLFAITFQHIVGMLISDAQFSGYVGDRQPLSRQRANIIRNTHMVSATCTWI